jgi:hypothetical protein
MAYKVVRLTAKLGLWGGLWGYHRFSGLRSPMSALGTGLTAPYEAWSVRAVLYR